MFSRQERVDILECFLANRKSPALAIREYRARFPDRVVPERKIFYKIYKDLRQHGSIDIKNKRKKVRHVLTEDKQLDILLHFEEFSETSSRLAAIDLDISRSSILRCLAMNGWRPYKFHPVQKLKEQDYPKRVEFCRALIDIIRLENLGKVLWTDEAIFTTAGEIFNRKNKHFWSAQNKKRTHVTQKQGRKSVKVWCGILKNKILGPIFYEGNMTSARYLNFLQNEIAEIIDAGITLQDRRNIIWQQDGAPYHRGRMVQDFLNEEYRVWIGERGTIFWPPRSPDLTPLDFFLWGALKTLVYDHKPTTTNELKIKIVECVRYLNTTNFVEKSVNHLRIRSTTCLN